MKERGESSVTNFLLFQGHNDAIKISAHSALSMWVKIRKYTMKSEMVRHQRVVIKASQSFLSAL